MTSSDDVSESGREFNSQKGSISLPPDRLSVRKYKKKRKVEIVAGRIAGVNSIFCHKGFEKSNDFWGDGMGSKESDCIRIITKNIGGLGRRVLNAKEIHLKQWMKEKEVDIIGLQELNINWSLCDQRERPLQRFKSLDGEWVRGSSSHNKNEIRKKHQFGGTLSLVMNEATKAVTATGADLDGLGRWSWVLLSGKRWSTRIVTAYKAVKNLDIKKSRAVYMQQKRYWQKKKS